MIAALYVERGGVYFGLADVDPWDEDRDARLYPGPWPVVAHPPCNRWCQLAHLNQKLYGLRVGDDGGCFESALASVRAWGGVLEHPAHSYAWAAFDLPEPPLEGWQLTFCGGWVARVDQGHFGHRGRKPTWLYAVVDEFPPALPWSTAATGAGWCLNGRRRRAADRLRGRAASRTPPAFRDVLLGIARSAGASEPRTLIGPERSEGPSLAPRRQGVNAAGPTAVGDTSCKSPLSDPRSGAEYPCASPLDEVGGR